MLAWMVRIVSFLLVSSLAALAVACDQEGPPSDIAVTLERAVAAMEQDGKIFYAEWEFPPEGDQVPRVKAWYWPERELLRTELHDQEAHRSTTIVSRQGEVSYQLDDGHLSDRRGADQQWDPMRGGIAAIFPHIGYWGIAQDRTVVGTESVDGRTVTHVRAIFTAEEDAHERPKGTTFTSDILVDATSLLPLSVTILIEFPTQEGNSQPGTLTFIKTEFVDPAGLPADFFDQDKLASEEVTLDEAIELARQASFPVFWLGREIDLASAAPDGTRYDQISLAEVLAPGLPPPGGQVAVTYSVPPDFAGPMLTIVSSSGPSFAGIRPSDLEVLQRTGSVTPLADGNGFIYARYVARGNCTLERAQLDPGCRMFAEPTYGVLLEREGTKIHLSVETLMSKDGRNLNPFNAPVLLGLLAGQLRPIGE